MDGSTVVTGAAPREASLERRRERTREVMAANGIELLIAYGSGNHSFFQAFNPAWWLTGFKQMGPHMAVLLPLEGEPVVIMTPRWDAARATQRSTIHELVSTEPADFLTTVGEELQNRQLRHKKTALILGGPQPREFCAAWPALLDQTPVNAEKLISDLARIRDEWSLICADRAMTIAEQGFQRLLETARTGVPEYQIVGEMEAHMRELGAEDNFMLMSASQHNRSVHAPTNRIIEAGDILLAEISPAVEGEYVQTCRTAVFGKPTQQQYDAFALLNEGLLAGMAMAKPGVPVSEVVHAINAPIEKAGYGQYCVPPHMRTRGHSMGLGSMDPQISLDSGHILEKNMLFVMHPNQYLPETGYFMCGEPVLITEDGAKPITTKMGKLESIL